MRGTDSSNWSACFDHSHLRVLRLRMHVRRLVSSIVAVLAFSAHASASADKRAAPRPAQQFVASVLGSWGCAEVFTSNEDPDPGLPPQFKLAVRWTAKNRWAIFEFVGVGRMGEVAAPSFTWLIGQDYDSLRVRLLSTGGLNPPLALASDQEEARNCHSWATISRMVERRGRGESRPS